MKWKKLWFLVVTNSWVLLIIWDRQSSRLRIPILTHFSSVQKVPFPWFIKISVLPYHPTCPVTKPLNYLVLAAAKEKPQAQNGITYDKAQDTRPRLHTWTTCSFRLPQRSNFRQPVWNFPIGSKEVISHACPLLSLPSKEEAIYLIQLPFFSPKRCSALK